VQLGVGVRVLRAELFHDPARLAGRFQRLRQTPARLRALRHPAIVATEHTDHTEQAWKPFPKPDARSTVRASLASEPRERPAYALRASARSRRSALREGGSAPAKRRARERVGESE
jgi:hypothetical protein